MIQGPDESRERAVWPGLIVGLLLGLALGWVVFYGLPALAAEPRVATPDTTITAALAATETPAAGSAFGLQGVAPSFTLRSPDGERWELDQQRGRVVLLNFWATWCVPCRVEMPLLQSVADQYPDDLLVLGVNFDETAEQVQAFAAELSIEFPLLLDPGGAVQELYRVRGYPTTAVVDRAGNLAAYHVGVLTADQLDGYLQEAGLFE